MDLGKAIVSPIKLAPFFYSEKGQSLASYTLGLVAKPIYEIMG